MAGRPLPVAEPEVQKTTLPSGIRVVTERMPGATSVSTGVWVGIGSRDEPESLAGVSHFLEHLLFKGTEDRSARSIAVAIDAAGGEMNAYTTREHTAFYTRLPADRLRFGLELLADVIARPAFRPPEVEAEREVILEEILMSEDSPEDVAMTALAESLFPDHGVGRETLGSRASIEAMPRDAIVAFHHDRYRPANLVVAAAGALEHDEVVSIVESLLADGDQGRRPDRVAPASEVRPRSVVARPTEQAHLALGWRALDQDDPDRYAFWIANHIIGGGMSSRLFQEVREERGLAYSVYTSPAFYEDCGALSLYAGTSPSRLHETVDVIDALIEGLLADGVTDEEVEVGRGYLVGSMLLGLEDTASRLARIGGSEISRNEVVPLEEHVERIRAVEPDDVNRVVRRVLGGPRATVLVGPFDGDESPV